MNTPATSAAPSRPDRRPAAEVRTSRSPWVSPLSLRNGLIAGLAMAAFYVAVVWAASGALQHLADQTRQDWVYLTAIIAGFAAQVTLTSEIRHRHALNRGAVAAGAAGAGASTAGMVACCAHHLADLLPLVGAATAAGFLTDYRVEFMLIGISINAVAVAFAALQLRRLQRQTDRC